MTRASAIPVYLTKEPGIRYSIGAGRATQSPRRGVVWLLHKRFKERKSLADRRELVEIRRWQMTCYRPEGWWLNLTVETMIL